MTAMNMVESGATSSPGLARGELAIRRAREFLRDALVAGRCHDTWHASEGAPPVLQSHAVFLTYFVARALAGSGGIEEAARSTISNYLASARRGDVYGYDQKAPPDADDTAFALRTRILIGDRPASEEVERGLLPFAFRESWLTFARGQQPAPGWTIEYRDESSVVGLHPEVHLNVLALLHEAGLPAPAVPAVPFRDGLPANYHYPSALYAAWLLGEVNRGQHAAEREMDQAVAARQRADGSWAAVEGGFSAAQETALALLSLSDSACASEVARRGAAFLLAQQGSDGGWPGGVLWKYYPPKAISSGIWWAEDSMSMMATGLAVSAIQRVLRGGAL
ncbi:hypothetical protein [Sorangium sp. So ce861]|uniref:hypothetical protein n=1 Tax=Sorangium sp. So ce861 TaxID=3133323 RepID=UPI003F5FCEEE